MPEIEVSRADVEQILGTFDISQIGGYFTELEAEIDKASG